ncbi:MAG: GNAT family N-acetyltransferase [Candidatus Dadabacteria bacterium]|nr:GNAT family N-acetyltransferase [Candidatus Dadabacteria bacterium]
MNKNGAAYRAARPGEETAVSNLVARSFNEFIAPDFSEEGVEEFFRYANPRSLKKRSEDSHFVLVAEAEGEIAGMIEVREMKHISMLFVDKSHHRKGIGKELLRLALDRIKSANSPPASVTVHSSRFAVPFYESLGFTKTSEEKIIYGVIHIPMALALPEGRILRREDSTRQEIYARRNKSPV